jgi:hypothetical protein
LGCVNNVYESNSEADAVQTAIYIEFKDGAVSTEIVQVIIVFAVTNKQRNLFSVQSMMTWTLMIISEKTHASLKT